MMSELVIAKQSRNKMKKTYILIALCVFLFRCDSIAEELEVESPDGSMIIRTGRTDSTLLLITIFDKDGKLLHKENTHVSRIHKWSVRWLDNRKILIESSDIGPVSIVLNKDGHFKRENPLRKLSPDGKLVAYTFWNDYKRKTITLRFFKSDGDTDSAYIVLHEFKTDIVVSELSDCARWEGNNKLVIKAVNQEYIWTREPGRPWLLIK